LKTSMSEDEIKKDFREHFTSPIIGNVRYITYKHRVTEDVLIAEKVITMAQSNRFDIFKKSVIVTNGEYYWAYKNFYKDHDKKTDRKTPAFKTCEFLYSKYIGK